ncbi:probable glutathione S-transferase GSTU6 [Aegilops tauschii subsp. strangulata]|uniref:Glutathione S-transferase n=1 Tax=Aegilops tauschii subsp. strangulata TaxID=200361 RepID=A0A453QEB4_AEGTS|nr:probable glutathione S-transferase GSTU6 [Aegilops tauschii subsp. strangulata]
MMAGAQQQRLKLLGPGTGVSMYTIRVQMALCIKELSYDFLPEDPWSKSDLLLASNPVYKKLPVLIHAGRPVCESLIIVQYLDDAFAGNGTSILPTDPYSRAVARFWASYIDDKLFPSCIGILKTAKQQERADKVEETLAAFGLLEAALAECSKEGEAEALFFGGGSLGLLDIALGCYLPWIEAIGHLAAMPPFLDAARTPKLAAWAERFRAAEPVRALLPAADKVEEYISTVLYPKWNAALTASATN